MVPGLSSIFDRQKFKHFFIFRVLLLGLLVLPIGCGKYDPSAVTAAPSPIPASPACYVGTFTGLAGGHADRVNAIAVDAGGNIYVAGSTFDSANHRYAFLSRYTGAGILDASFNAPNGFVTSAPSGFSGGSFDSFNSLKIDGAGKLLLAGSSADSSGRLRSLIARYLSTGALDTAAFNAPSGYLTGAPSGYGGGGKDDVTSLAIDPGTTTIYTGGNTKNLGGTQSIFINSFTNGGVINSAGFGAPSGYVVGAPSGFAGGSFDSLNALAWDPGSNKLVAAGNSNNGGGSYLTLAARYTSAGALDTPGFNAPSGYHLGPLAGFGTGQFDQFNAAVILPGSKILAAGFSRNALNGNQTLLVQLTSAGVLDTAAFNSPQGFLLGPSAGFAGGGSDFFSALALDIGGNYVATGSSADNAGFRGLVTRYLPSGAADVSLNASGSLVSALNTCVNTDRNSLNSVYVDSANRLVVGGSVFHNSAYQQSLLVRFQSSGVRDF